jgi:Ca-activated chloride channel family protein
VKTIVRALGAVLAPVLLLASAAGSSAPLEPPRWIAALYLDAQSSVGLRWAPVPGATGYKVLRSIVKGKDHREVAAPAEPQYFDKAVERGGTYFYVLQAVAGGDTSRISEEKTVTVPGMRLRTTTSPELTEPRASTTTEFGKSSAKVGLEWKKDESAVAYNVYRREEGSNERVLVGSTSDERYLDANVDPNKKYHYSVSALDQSFTESAPSTERAAVVARPEQKKMERAETRPVGSAAPAAPPPQAPPPRMPQALAARGEDIPVKEGPAAVAPSPAPGEKGRGYRGTAGQPFSPAMNGQHPGQPMPGPTYSSFGESFDEVWVISRPERPQAPAPGEYLPGCGELRAERDGRRLPFPLEHTEVEADLAGYIATVRVSQRYRNPFEEKIEAVYLFPLPDNAAVSDFVMTIGKRRIRGIIREREEAERVYADARRQGYQAALLTQERPNIFTQKVANIEPGKAITVDIVYFNTLAYHDGAFSFVFPMVVGPRYNPAGSTDGVGAVPRGAGGISGQGAEVQYLAPGERTGNDIALSVKIAAGMPIEQIESPSHVIDVRRDGDERATVRLRRTDSIPNKDFVLNIRTAGAQPRQALFLQRDGAEGWFTLLLMPPSGLEHLKRPPLEMVFLVDTSGSMNGWPIEKAKAALRRAVKSLSPGDTFQIVRFSGDNARFRPVPVAATPENIAAGLSFLDGLRGAGGTEMVQGIRAALDFPRDPGRFRIVSFMTDGFVGNEAQVLQAVAELRGDARIFSFGVGTSVNRYLMEGLARVGRGAVAYIVAGDSDTEAVDRFFERIASPALTDIAVDWGGMEVSGVYPERIPDLFVGRPVILTGRFTGTGKTSVAVTGTYGGERVTQKIKVKLDKTQHEGIARIWARARIAALSDELPQADAVRQGDIRGEIKATALTHGLVSSYTAFVAVDATRVTEGDHGVTVVQPVPVPEGVRYDTTVLPFE